MTERDQRRGANKHTDDMLDTIDRLEAENEALRHDIERHIANHAADLSATQGADARPVAIYQVRFKGQFKWLDVEQAGYDLRCGEDYERRIVYATRDAAPNINEQRYLWLREQRWNESNVAVVLAPKKAVKLGYDCPSGQRLDEIIDAARSAIAPREKTK